MVTFTLGSYPLRPEKIPEGAVPGLELCISFNIKHVILLYDATVQWGERAVIREQPWGVLAPDNSQEVPSETVYSGAPEVII